MEKFKKIFDVLDLTKNNGLFILEEDDWQLHCNFSKRVEHLIKDVLKPYAFYYFNQTPFIFFFDNPTNLEQLEEQIWNFNQTPVVFINHSNQIHIRNGFSYIKTKEKKGLAELANFDKSNEEISEAFLIRVSDFANESTNFSFIIKRNGFRKGAIIFI